MRSCEHTDTTDWEGLAERLARALRRLVADSIYGPNADLAYREADRSLRAYDAAMHDHASDTAITQKGELQ